MKTAGAMLTILAIVLTTGAVGGGGDPQENFDQLDGEQAKKVCAEGLGGVCREDPGRRGEALR